jgi:hypothetical protein
MTERMNIRRMQGLESTPFRARFDVATDIDQAEWGKIGKYMREFALKESREGISPKFYNRQKLRSFAALKVASPSQFTLCVGGRQILTRDQIDDISLTEFTDRELAEDAVAVKTIWPEMLRRFPVQLHAMLEEMQKMRNSNVGNDFGLSIMFAGNIKRLFPESQPMDDDFTSEAKEYVTRLLKGHDDPRLQERDAMSALAFAAQIRICRPDQAVHFTRAQWRLVTDALHESLRHDIGERDSHYILYAAIVGADDVRTTDHGLEITPPSEPEVKAVPEVAEIV